MTKVMHNSINFDPLWLDIHDLHAMVNRGPSNKWLYKESRLNIMAQSTIHLTPLVLAHCPNLY